MKQSIQCQNPCVEVLNAIIVLNVITFGPKCNKPSLQSFNCAGALLLKWQLLHQKNPHAVAPKNPLTNIHGILQAQLLISVFLFAKDVGWEALATKPYTDVLLASNWQTQKQWECWSIALFILLAQTATDFDDIIVWLVLKSTLHEPHYKKKEVHWPSCSTNSGLRSAFFVLSFLARFVWVCMKYIHMHYWPSWGQNGWILAEFFFLHLWKWDEVSVQ